VGILGCFQLEVFALKLKGNTYFTGLPVLVRNHGVGLLILNAYSAKA